MHRGIINFATDWHSGRGLWLVLITTVLFAPAHALDPHRSLIELNLQSWETQHGLPHNMVQDIAQTPDGYLWLATWEGVARFNGFEFLVFSPDNVPELKAPGIRTLLAASDGTLWLGTSGGGVTRLRNNIWRTIMVDDGLSGNSVLTLAEDSAGRIWVGTENQGLSIIDGNEITRLSTTEGLSDATVLAIAELAPGEMWVGTPQGINRIKSGNVSSYDQHDGLPPGPVLSITASRAGELIVGTENGVFRWNGQGFQPDPAWMEAGSGEVSELFEDSDGILWAGTFAKGLYRLQGNNAEFLRTSNGLPNNRVTAIFEDREGNLWVGTSGGLARLKSAPFSALNMRNGLPDNYVRTIFESRDGTLWIGTSNGLTSIARNHMRTYTTADGLTSNSILALREMRSGDLWIGTYGTGINILSDGAIRTITAEDGLPSNHVRSFVEARDGSIWVATIAGLAHFVDGQQVRVFRRTDGLPSAFITSLHEDPDGTLWIGTTQGFTFLRNDLVVPASDVPSHARGTVFGFYRDRHDNMWIATTTGLLRFFKGQIQTIRRDNGLPHEVLFAITGDHLDSLWMSSNDGVFRASIADLVEVAEGNKNWVNIERFTEDHGLPSRQCNGGSEPSLIRSQTGRLWFATSQGVAVVDPDILASERSAAVAPKIVIERLVIDGVPTPISPLVEVPLGATHIEFHYAGMSFRAAENIKYHYQLAGFEKGPTNAGLRRIAHYTNLDPGDYTFQVWGSLDAASWSEQPGVVYLHVQPQFWETGLFKVLAVVLFLLTLTTLLRVRMRALNYRAAALRQEIASQTRDLQEKTDRLELAGEEKSRLLVKLEEQSQAFEKLAQEDALTGLANRRHFDEVFEQQFTHTRLSAEKLAVALLDVDHFKRINDDYSHQVGDEVLKVLADLLRDASGAKSTPARYGGEEFVLLFPGLNAVQASKRCDTLRQALKDHDFSAIATDLQVTISAGVSANLDVENFEKMLSDADHKLYEAKRSGRDRVCY